MDFLEEFALLGAIGLPIALVTAANIYLALTGESGTLLLPGMDGVGEFLRKRTARDGAESAGPGGA